jgi:hypothetical protein
MGDDIKERTLRGLGGLESGVLAHTYDMQHEVTGSWLQEAIRDIMWSRHGIGGGDWPRKGADEPLLDSVGAMRSYPYVMHCDRGICGARYPELGSVSDLAENYKLFPAH